MQGVPQKPEALFNFRLQLAGNTLIPTEGLVQIREIKPLD